MHLLKWEILTLNHFNLAYSHEKISDRIPCSVCAEPGLRQRPDMSNTKITLPRVTWGWQQDLCVTQGLWQVQSPSKLFKKPSSVPVSQQSDGDHAFLVLLLAQLGCHYIIHGKSWCSQVTSVLGPSPKPCPAPVSAGESPLRGKPCCFHAGHRARLPTWDGHWWHWGRGSQGHIPPVRAIPALFYLAGMRLSCCLTQWRCFRGMRIFSRACNKANCWRQNNKTGSLSSSSGSAEANALKIAIFYPTASHRNISKTDTKRPATNHPGT